MSLRPHTLEPVPEETAHVARAAFPKGNPYLLLRDTCQRRPETVCKRPG